MLGTAGGSSGGRTGFVDVDEAAPETELLVATGRSALTCSCGAQLAGPFCGSCGAAVSDVATAFGGDADDKSAFDREAVEVPPAPPVHRPFHDAHSPGWCKNPLWSSTF